MCDWGDLYCATCAEIDNLRPKMGYSWDTEQNLSAVLAFHLCNFAHAGSFAGLFEALRENPTFSA